MNQRPRPWQRAVLLLVAFAVVIATLTSLQLLLGSYGPTVTNGPDSSRWLSVVSGVSPNPNGTTNINTDTGWSGTIFAGGDIVIGTHTSAINVTWSNCVIQVNGRILLDSLPGGFKPVTFRVMNCTVTFGLSTSKFFLDHSDPSLSGVDRGSSILITNSTFKSDFNDSWSFPAGFVLYSGSPPGVSSNYNVARVRIDNSTFVNLGNYWESFEAAIDTRWPGDYYSRFTNDSYLRGLSVMTTFIDQPNPSRTQEGNSFGMRLGDSLPVQDSYFYGLYIAIAFTKYVKNVMEKDVCRNFYDPLEGAVISDNRVENNPGAPCKNIDFFHPQGRFENNTVLDAGGNFADGSAWGTRVIGNTFIRGGPGDNGGPVAHDLQFWNNLILDTPGNGIWDRGTMNTIQVNSILNSLESGIVVEAHPLDNYVYQNPRVWDNTIDGFWPYNYAIRPGLILRDATGGSILRNSVANGYLGVYLHNVTNTDIENLLVTNVTEGIEIDNSSSITVRNSTLSTSGPSILLMGGNHDIKFKSVQYRSLSFADASDIFQYYDYADLFLPTTNDTAFAVHDGTGALVRKGVIKVGALRSLELHLFNQTQSAVTSYNPFTFELSGLVAGEGYTVYKNGIPVTTVTANGTGSLAFQLTITDRTVIVVTPSPVQIDGTPPAQIMDLSALSAGSGRWALFWTAPGNHGMNGTAYRYEVRYTPQGPITAANWANATLYNQSWTPLAAGSSEAHTTVGLNPSLTYWVAIRAASTTLNWSGVSNSARISRQYNGSSFVLLQARADRLSTPADGVVNLAAYASDVDGRTFYIDANWTAQNGTVGLGETYHPWATGSWNICASYSNLTDCIVVTVVPGALSSLDVTPSSLVLGVGDTASLAVSARDSKRNPIPDIPVTWQVEPTSLGQVSEGDLFHAEASGDGVIHLTATYGNVTESASVTVTVLTGSSVPGSNPGVLSLASVLATLLVAVGFGASLLGTALFLRRIRSDSAPDPMEPGETSDVEYRCPVCDAVVQESDVRCPSCNARFES